MKRPDSSFSHVWGGLRKSLHRLSHFHRSFNQTSLSQFAPPFQTGTFICCGSGRGAVWEEGRHQDSLSVPPSISDWAWQVCLEKGRWKNTNRCRETIHTLRSVRPKCETGTIFRGRLAHRTQHSDMIKYKRKTTLSLCWLNERGAAMFCFFRWVCSWVLCRDVFLLILLYYWQIVYYYPMCAI